MDTVRSNSNQKDNNIAVVYLRVSTKEQEEKGNSLNTQKKSTHEYARNNNLHILETFKESESASKIHNVDFDISSNLVKSLSNRPELKRIVKMAQNRKFQHLIVQSRDRLVRNFEMFIALRYFFKKYNITIHYTRTGENLSDNKINRFIELVLSSIAELESNLISTRVKSGLEEKVKQGYWPCGRAPYGYLLVKNDENDKKKLLQPSISKSDHVITIFNLYNCGYSYRKIADIMNDQPNTIIWTKSKIESIIKNPIYTGDIVYNRRSRNREVESELIKSKHIEDIKIIDESKWKDSESLRSKKYTLDAKYFNTPFLLRNKLICGKCNEEMITKNYGKDRKGKQRDTIYKCKSCSLILKKDEIESLFLKEFLNTLKSSKSRELWKVYSSRVIDEKSNNNLILEEELKSIDKKSRTANRIDDLLQGNISSPMIDALISEKTKLKQEINEHENRIKYIKNLKFKYMDTQKELQGTLDKFFSEDFLSLENTRKRIIIDTLIDNVTVNKNDDISIDITIKTSINVL